MRLHKIRLEHIRSYISEEVVFPEGKVLLWGNIGSGKSTILLAIDFAFFGLQRSELAGNSLLRNGMDEGTVELFFSLDDKEYVLKRALKRTKTAVVQDAGYIIRDGVREDKTAIELKQIVLDLLHYPKELITKNKALIYRYTVYTPQEEMKTILLGPKEERLDTLRKVFGVDKYKRVKENVKIVVSELKERKKLYEGATADLQEKILEREQKEREKQIFEEKLAQVAIRIEDAQAQLMRKKEELQVVEAKREEALKVKKEFALSQVELRHKQEQKETLLQKIAVLKKEVEALEIEKLELQEDVKETIKALDESIIIKEKDIREALNKIQELKTRKTHALQIRQKVESLNNCPTCFQEVSQEYKQKVVEKSVGEIHDFDAQMKQWEEMLKKQEGELRGVRAESELLKKKQHEIALVRLKMEHLQKKREERAAMQETYAVLEKGIFDMGVQLAALHSKQEEFVVVEGLYIPCKLAVDSAMEALHLLQIEKANVASGVRHTVDIINALAASIAHKIRLREKKEYANKVQFWLTDHFIPMLDTMEKNILFKVHAEFNALFEKWFSILIDNQMLLMSLDEEYSPKIVQNGYDIEYEFLSGGEKTAGALAYRLALNQVINTMNAGIKTKDILILDEPTDGFSHEQLDRLKILMDEIAIPQIILVSHEAQIECFANHIIRFEKRDHVTKVIS